MQWKLEFSNNETEGLSVHGSLSHIKVSMGEDFKSKSKYSQQQVRMIIFATEPLKFIPSLAPDDTETPF